MDLQLADRAYVVTGGTSGLGRATADLLVAEGAAVVVGGRTQAKVDAAVAALGDRAAGVVGDNADPAVADRLVSTARARFGRLDGALVSVGGPAPGSAQRSSEEDWRRAFESVVLGGLRVARAVAEAMDGPGSIAFVLSTSVKAPIAGLAISNGLRPGLAMVAKQLADELGPRQVRVNGLLPGRIATARVAELDAASGDPAAARAASEAAIPLGRYGRPEEFAAAATFLLSPMSSFVNGTMLAVDGGMTRAL